MMTPFAIVQSYIQHVNLFNILQAKAGVLQKIGKDSFGHYQALTYKSQVVAGTNYFVKVSG